MNTTEKIEKPTRRDTGKLPDLVAWAKDSGTLRLVLIFASSGIGQQVLQAMGEGDARWWMIAAGLGTWWIVSELKEIKTTLRAVLHKTNNHGDRLAILEAPKPDKLKRKSRGDLPVLAPDIN